MKLTGIHLEKAGISSYLLRPNLKFVQIPLFKLTLFSLVFQRIMYTEGIPSENLLKNASSLFWH